MLVGVLFLCGVVLICTAAVRVGCYVPRYTFGATAFVDHVSDYTHVAIMRALTSDETLLAKTSFERLAND